MPSFKITTDWLVYSLVTCYLSAFFTLPVETSTGESLTFEQVVDRLDDETVSYEANLGVGSYFAENFRASIKVEKERYEEAVMWLKDLIYGSKFDLARYAFDMMTIASRPHPPPHKVTDNVRKNHARSPGAQARRRYSSIEL